MPEIKERPILFSAPMVRAILAGEKTVTRRALNATAVRDIGYGARLSECYDLPTSGPIDENSLSYIIDFCPYGQPGDRLWVRESFWHAGAWVPTYPEDDSGEWSGTRRVHYRADGAPPNEPNHHYPNNLRNGAYSAADPAKIWRTRPSIHMPRWASRILLEITSVRVERLQTITDEQCVAEGCGVGAAAIGVKLTVPPGASLPRTMFAELWKSINGASAWDANPWVWVVEFKRVTP